MSSDGFFAEYGVLTSAAEIFKLPENMSFEAAALLEPFCVSLNAVDIADFKIGLKVAVLGPGPIGLFALQILKAGGAGKIMITGADGDEKRLDLAKQLGADLTINVMKEDPVKLAREMSRGGLDIVFEATGNPKAVQQALDMVRNGGKVILIGIHSGPASFDPTPMVRRRKSIICAYSYSAQTWQRSIELISGGVIDAEAVITHRVPLDRAEEGFRLALEKEAAKVLFIP
jgi:2-desacetyl-2-hydroxyethyl bacteriochlorophyllide A dehydrogenase